MSSVHFKIFYKQHSTFWQKYRRLKFVLNDLASCFNTIQNLHYDNTYNDFTYNDFTYNDFTFNDFTYNDFTFNDFT